jgi:hypothetical protein
VFSSGSCQVARLGEVASQRPCAVHPRNLQCHVAVGSESRANDRFERDGLNAGALLFMARDYAKENLIDM